MEEQFWQSRWDAGEIAFHEPAPNALLSTHLATLKLAAQAHIFVPLCGKSHDLDWLLAQGHRVSGIEFNRGAVEAVFARLGLEPDVTRANGLHRLSHGDLTIWQGDAFALTAEAIGPVDAIYDRAALVALPATTRPSYAQHLMDLTRAAPQLLISFDYDQSQTSGPPFSVPEAELRAHYGAAYGLDKLAGAPISGKLAERCAGAEEVWHLTPKV